jgi:alkylation response protein AidB-like acyl-CoA dehydrogenase
VPLAREGIELETAGAAESLLAHAWTATARRRWVASRIGTLPAALWRDAEAAGWFDILVERSSGGLGLGVVEACAVAESAGRHLVPGPVADTIVLRPATQPHVGSTAVALTRPAAGTAQAASVRAGMVIAARLRVDWARAAAHLVVDAGTSIVLVDAHDERVRITPMTSLDAFCAASAVELDMAPAVAVLASGAEAEALRTRVERQSLLLATSALVGIADAAFAMSLEYARERSQFSRPIGTFQAVQHRLTDMRVTLESMRSLGCLAQVALRDGEADAGTMVMSAKAHASAGARQIVESALQVHGGIGFTADCDLSLYVLRTLTLQTALGDDTALSRSLGRAALGLPMQGEPQGVTAR